MNAVFMSAALALLLSILLGLAQVFRHRGRADSLLAALLFGSTGAALVLVLAKALGLSRGADIALVFALLAAVLGVAFVVRGWPSEEQTGGQDP